MLHRIKIKLRTNEQKYKKGNLNSGFDQKYNKQKIVDCINIVHFYYFLDFMKIVLCNLHLIVQLS